MIDFVFSLSILLFLLDTLQYPLIQKFHLLLCMKPMLTICHDRQRGLVMFAELSHGFKRC